ncbi:hypothetical protein SAMN04489835_1071 [Mycolicibacterium rutilum]|uniref:Uncharacterized protein n=1 Tax=Mycolicibacterium rutilum TaxID=370526 RepID=A0A1H6IYB4_MYCRU|nr:hypothetical protein [Mycolicibacterium rutilum]SEH53250.1 hypothetical protein SAMN04489835_1071 [Mycolicibacterium rutilum]
MYRHDADDGRPTTIEELTTFRLGVPTWPAFMYLRGGDPLVRRTDRIEAVVLLLAALVSVMTIPVALAVTTAVHDGRGTVAVGVIAGAVLWIGVSGAAAAAFLATRSVCERIRSASWQRGLDALVDHGDGQARSHP